MKFVIIHQRIGTDIWANTRLKIINRMIKEKNKIVLDLGCGKGYLGESLQKNNKIIFADINIDEIKNIKGEKLILNAIKLPFKKETFDYIICGDMLEHIKDDKIVLKEIYQTLKKGGKAIITIPAYSKLYGHHDKLIGHYRRYDKKDFARTVKEDGYHIKSVRYTCSLLFFPWFFNQLFFKTKKTYVGKSKIENKIKFLLNFISWMEATIRLPFGINLNFILEK